MHQTFPRFLPFFIPIAGNSRAQMLCYEVTMRCSGRSDLGTRFSVANMIQVHFHAIPLGLSHTCTCKHFVLNEYFAFQQQPLSLSSPNPRSTRSWDRISRSCRDKNIPGLRVAQATKNLTRMRAADQCK